MHVIINGVSSETLQGVQVLSLPPITKPRMRTSVAVIDGRPGDIVTRLGYEAYNRKIQILLHHDYDIDAISAFFNTSGTIIFSNEPDMEYEFETIDAFSFERAVRYKTADITFHVQPYKLSATEQPATGDVSTLVDKTPYIIRRTPAGTRQKGTIVGGSIVWNQLFPTKTNSFTGDGYTILFNGDGSATVTVTADTASGTNSGNVTSLSAGTMTLGHKYLWTGEKNGISLNLKTLSRRTDTVFECTNAAFTNISVIFSSLAKGTYTIYPQLSDLTLMFGATIADYIYSVEQASAGAGVALAKAWGRITADYNPYDPGSIKSVTGLTAHKMTGFNQFVESNLNSLSGITQTDDGWEGKGVNWNRSTNVEGWENVTYFPNTAYCATVELTTRESVGVRVRWEYTDGTATDGTLISANTHGRTTVVSNPAKTIKNCHLTFGSAGAGVITVHNFCISISSSRNGQYEPYTVHTYPLDSSLTFRGLPKLDGDNLYYDGDIYKADGTVERRYALVEVDGSNDEAWNLQSINANNIANFSLSLNNKQNGGGVCNRFMQQNTTIANTTEEGFFLSVNTLYIRISSSKANTVASFRTWLSNNIVTLVYELATPTAEQAEPYTELQICDPDGTEEWVGASMPVGHDTTYIDPISMTVTNEGNTESAPSITIEGEGAVEVTVDGLNILQIQMPASGEITIDSKTLDATDGEGGLANRSVTGDYNDLRLAPGEHTVTVTGDVTSVTLKNTSRWI